MLEADAAMSRTGTTSAGLLLYRWEGEDMLVLLVHPGGPYWQHRDLGAWSIPKGELRLGEEPEEAALREFEEELGVRPIGDLHPLGEIRQKGGKRVIAFAIASDLNVSTITSNEVELEWPPRSGKRQRFPEVDRAEWFPIALARNKILDAQHPLLDRLAEAVSREA
jgi:predicted NUDIX family NTP pyrophosphohydrolase